MAVIDVQHPKTTTQPYSQYKSDINGLKTHTQLLYANNNILIANLYKSAFY